MLYIFSGDDSKRKLLAYEKFLKSIPKNIEKFSINRNNFNSIDIENFYAGGGLFSKKHAILFSDILEKDDIRENLFKKFEGMGASESMFIFLERKLNKSVLDMFKKHEGEVNVFELPKEKKEKFNNFLLANAFGEKDKLHLWIYYRQAVECGVGLEELVGVLFWKMKDLLIKNNFRKFSPEQLKNLVAQMPYLLPEARKKGMDAEIAFEKFLLEIF